MPRITRRAIAIGALVPIAFTLAACSAEAPTADPTAEAKTIALEQPLSCDSSPTTADVAAYTAPKADSNYSITFLEVSLNSYFYQALKAGAEDAAEAAGVTVTVLAADGYTSPEVQLQQAETAVLQGTDALILTPSDYNGSQPVIDLARENDLPVLVTASGIADASVPRVVQDDYRLGELLADLVSKTSSGSGIMMAGPENADWSRNRTAGFASHAAELGLDVVASPTGLVDPNAQLELFTSAAQAHPDLDWLSSVFYFMPPGSALPTEYRGTLPYFTAGYDPDAAQSIADGYTTATIGTQAYAQGFIAMSEIVSQLNGDEIPATTCLPMPVFTADETPSSDDLYGELIKED